MEVRRQHRLQRRYTRIGLEGGKRRAKSNDPGCGTVSLRCRGIRENLYDLIRNFILATHPQQQGCHCEMQVDSDRGWQSSLSLNDPRQLQRLEEPPISTQTVDITRSDTLAARRGSRRSLHGVSLARGQPLSAFA
jgi:hypothetical protein